MKYYKEKPKVIEVLELKTDNLAEIVANGIEVIVHSGPTYGKVTYLAKFEGNYIGLDEGFVMFKDANKGDFGFNTVMKANRLENLYEEITQ